MNTPALSLLLACLRPRLPARWCFRDNQGSDHCIALGADGTIYSWGSTGNGCLGRAVGPGAAGSTAPPDVVPMPDGAGKVVFVDCEHRSAAVLLTDFPIHKHPCTLHSVVDARVQRMLPVMNPQWSIATADHYLTPPPPKSEPRSPVFPLRPRKPT